MAHVDHLTPPSARQEVKVLFIVYVILTQRGHLDQEILFQSEKQILSVVKEHTEGYKVSENVKDHS